MGRADGMAVKMVDMMKKRLEEILSLYEGDKGEVIPLLQAVQREFGYLPEQAMAEIAQFTGVPSSRVYGVATFYAQFRFAPIGRKHVMVCRGTGCHVNGAPRILEEIERHLGIKEGETTADLEYSLDTVACIGACGLSPCIVINDKIEGKVTLKKVAELFSKDGRA